MSTFDNCIVRQLKSTDNITGFRCGDKDLDDFIEYQAKDYGAQRLAYNYVMFGPSKAVAYFSLANDRISIDDFDSKTRYNRFRRKYFVNSKRLKGYPAVKLCRFAVDMQYRGCRVGTSLLNMIKELLANHTRSACRFLIVDANRDAEEFYIKNGFLRINDAAEGQTIPMYFDLKMLQ